MKMNNDFKIAIIDEMLNCYWEGSWTTEGTLMVGMIDCIVNLDFEEMEKKYGNNTD